MGFISIRVLRLAAMVRVRFAPSPTGSLHLGGALVAVANRRFADEQGGTLLLRIDDTDPARNVRVARTRSSPTSSGSASAGRRGPSARASGRSATARRRR